MSDYSAVAGGSLQLKGSKKSVRGPVAAPALAELTPGLASCQEEEEAFQEREAGDRRFLFPRAQEEDRGRGALRAEAERESESFPLSTDETDR